MKKTYIIPQTSISYVESEMMLAASVFQTGTNSQSITPTDEEYDGEFSAKSALDGDFWE